MRKKLRNKNLLVKTIVISSILTTILLFIFFFKFIKKTGLVFPNPLTAEGQKIVQLKDKLSESKLEILSGPNLIDDSNDIEVIISPGIKIIFSSENSISQQIITLQLILNKSKIDNQQNNNYPKIIDLRTSKPYVTF